MGPRGPSMANLNLLQSTGSFVVTASDAIACCEAHGDWFEATLRSILGDIYNALLDTGSRSGNLSLALTTSAVLGTQVNRVITIAETGLGPAVPGILVLLTATELSKLVGSTQALKTMNVVYQAIDTMLTERDGSRCETCVRLKALGQSKPRKTVVEKIKKRV